MMIQRRIDPTNPIEANLLLASKIISWLLNAAPKRCKGEFTDQELSDAIGTCWALANAIAFIERVERKRAGGEQ